jgi:hypothetical protein
MSIYRIKDTWLHLKSQELGSRVFEDEYDLAVLPHSLRKIATIT